MRRGSLLQVLQTKIPDDKSNASISAETSVYPWSVSPERSEIDFETWPKPYIPVLPTVLLPSGSLWPHLECVDVWEKSKYLHGSAAFIIFRIMMDNGTLWDGKSGKSLEDEEAAARIRAQNDWINSSCILQCDNKVHWSRRSH